MMTKIVSTSLAAAAVIAGLAWISSAPASTASNTPRHHVARGVPVTLTADGLATGRGTIARGVTKEADAVATAEIQVRRPRAATSAN